MAAVIQYRAFCLLICCLEMSKFEYTEQFCYGGAWGWSFVCDMKGGTQAQGGCWRYAEENI
jgi:hypothetical protein